MSLEKELLIDYSNDKSELALIENKKLVELHTESAHNDFAVGDIFLGRVKKLMPGMNAAFVDIGHKKDAFVHYTDLGPTLKSVIRFTKGGINNSKKGKLLENFVIEPDIDKNGKITDVLTKKQLLLVQIQKEPISTKGHRLTSEVTIPGRHLVMAPFTNVVAISKKIKDADERIRLTNLIESIKPKNFGIIVRTAAEGKMVAELHQEISELEEKWEKIYKALHKADKPKKLHSELDKMSSIIRDLLGENFSKIVVNDKDVYEQARTYISRIAPEKLKIVDLYKGDKPIFDVYGVTKQIKSSFGKTATMSSGAYLVIEHTEAMHVVDVNSGNKSIRNNQEDSSLAVNLESAQEVARQLRLRDIGGIIIVDFIDMKSVDNRKELQRQMKEFMKNDRAQHTILPLSKFGLMQITRQRVKPQLVINTQEKCPSCNGTGKIDASIALADQIQSNVTQLLEHGSGVPDFYIELHPYLAAFLTSNFWKIQRGWYMKYKRWISIRPNESFPLVEYKIMDKVKQEKLEF